MADESPHVAVGNRETDDGPGLTSELSAQFIIDTVGELGVLITTIDVEPLVRLDPVARRLFDVEEPGDVPLALVLERVVPADRELVLARRAGFRAHPPIDRVDVEIRVAPRAGGLRRLAAVGRVRRDLQGEMGEVTILVRDVTQRRQVEDDLAALSTTFQAALGAMDTAVFISDVEGRLVHFNDAFASFHRFESRDDCATTLAEYPEFLDVYLPSGELARLDQWAVPSALRGERATNAEFTLVRRDTGATWQGSYNYAPILDGSGAIVGSVVTARDVTDRNRARREQAKEVERRAYLSRLQDALAFLAEPREMAETAIQLLAQHVGAAEAYYLRVEHDRDALVPLFSFGPGRPAEPVDVPLAGAHETLDLLRDGAALVVEDTATDTRLTTKARAVTAKLGQRALLAVPHLRAGQLVGLVLVADRSVRRWSDDDQALVADVVERIAQALDRSRWQAALQDSEARLASVIDTAADSIVVIDDAGIIVSANQATIATFGYSADELVGRNVSVLMAEQDAARHDRYLDHYLDTGVSNVIAVGREVEGRRRDGTLIPVDLAVTEWRDSGGRRFFTGILRDITQRKRQEEALTIARRLEAVGQLAGGVAHDFNNLLMVIGGSLEIAQSRIDDAKTRQLIDRAASAVHRGISFNNRLLAITRHRPVQPEQLDLAARVEELGQLVKAAVGDTINVEIRTMPGLWTASLDAGELDTALLNLAANARNAMPDGGTLQVAAANTTLRPGNVPHAGAAPGDYVVLSVRDTGRGMTPDVRTRAVDPFFTTAPPGQGTGLGLTSVARFAHDSGGFLTIDSAVGRGTTATLYFPRASVAAPAPRPVPPTEPVPAARRVLVVEDDELVRETAMATVESLGYVVHAVSNAAEAISYLRAGHGTDIVLTDVVMPGDLDGNDLARWISSNHPHLPVVICSGYNAQATPSGQARTRFLAKPYTRDQLARTFHALLHT